MKTNMTMDVLTYREQLKLEILKQIKERQAQSLAPYSDDFDRMRLCGVAEGLVEALFFVNRNCDKEFSRSMHDLFCDIHAVFSSTAHKVGAEIQRGAKS